MTNPASVPPMPHTQDPDPMRINYRPLSDAEKEKMAKMKMLCAAVWDHCDDMGNSRELSLAKTYVETACMWITKHLTR